MPWKGWCMQICFPCHALKSLSLSLSNSQENDATAQKHIHEYRDYYSETSLCGKQELNSFSLSRWRRRSLPLIRHPTLVMIIMGSFFIVQYSRYAFDSERYSGIVCQSRLSSHSLTHHHHARDHDGRNDYSRIVSSEGMLLHLFLKLLLSNVKESSEEEWQFFTERTKWRESLFSLEKTICVGTQAYRGMENMM